MKGLLNLFWVVFGHLGGVVEAIPAAIIFSTAWLKAEFWELVSELKAVVCLLWV